MLHYEASVAEEEEPNDQPEFNTVPEAVNPDLDLVEAFEEDAISIFGIVEEDMEEEALPFQGNDDIGAVGRRTEMLRN